MNILEYRRKALGYVYRADGDYDYSTPPVNEAVRQMYLTQVGREPDAGGLAYFATRFGTEVSPAELQTFRDMAAEEVAAVEAQRAAAAAPAATTTASTTTASTTAPAATTTAGSAESVATPAAAAPAATTQSIREKIAASLGVPVGSVGIRYGTTLGGREGNTEVQDTSKVLGYAVKNNDELGSLFDTAGNTTGYYIPKNPSSMGEQFLDSLEDVGKVALVAAAAYYGIPWLINAGAAAAGATVTATAGAAASGFTVSGFLAAPGLTIGTALGITNPIAAALAGNIIIQTATNGGDVEKAIKGAVLSAGLSYAGTAVSGALNTALKDINLPDIVKTGIANGATALVTAKATGQNPLNALVGSALSTAIGGVVKSMPSIGNIPAEARNLATAAVTAYLTGKDVTNATLNAALAEGKKAAAGYIDVATGLSPDVKAIAEAYKDPSRALDVVQPAADTVTATQQAIDDQVAAALDSSSTDPAEAAAIFKAVYGRDPAAGELADYMGTSEADVTALLGQQFLDLTNSSLANGVVTAGLGTGTVTDAGSGSSPSKVDVSGIAITADNPEAASLVLPSGYRVATFAEVNADKSPSGTYYDAGLNAWLAPTGNTVADTSTGSGTVADTSTGSGTVADTTNIDEILAGSGTTTSTGSGTVADTTNIDEILAGSGTTTSTGSGTVADTTNIDQLLADNGLTTVTGGTGSGTVAGTTNIDEILAGSGTGTGTGTSTGTGTTTQSDIEKTLFENGLITGTGTTGTGTTGTGTTGTGTTGTGGTDSVTGTGGTDSVTGTGGTDSVTTGTGGTDSVTGTGGTDTVTTTTTTPVTTTPVTTTPVTTTPVTTTPVTTTPVTTTPVVCAEGFHEDPVTGLCVPDDDEVVEECPLGEVRNLTTGLCEKVTDTTPVTTTPVTTTPVVTTPVVTTPVVTKPPVIPPVKPPTPVADFPSSVETQTTTKPGPLVAPREGAASEGDPLDNLLKLLARYKTGQNEGSGYGGVSASGFEMAEGGLLDSQDDSYSTGDPYLDELLATLR